MIVGHLMPQKASAVWVPAFAGTTACAGRAVTASRLSRLEKNLVQPHRSFAPLLHSRRSLIRLPDPEPAVWCVLGEWSRAAPRRCDRRLRARSLGACAGRPAGCLRTRGVCGRLAQFVHGARAEGLDAHACADQRTAAA